MPAGSGASVVDASALAALVFGEPRGSKVARRLGSGPLLAPTLLRYEMGSICLKKLRQHPERRERILQAYSLYEAMEIDEVEVPVRELLPIAERLRLTVHDTSYLWLARALGCRIVTLDQGLKRAARL